MSSNMDNYRSSTGSRRSRRARRRNQIGNWEMLPWNLDPPNPICILAPVRSSSTSDTGSRDSSRAPRPPASREPLGWGSRTRPWPGAPPILTTTRRPSASSAVGSRETNSSTLQGPSHRGSSSDREASLSRATPASGYPARTASRGPDPQSFAADSRSSSSGSIPAPQRQPTTAPVSDQRWNGRTPAWWAVPQPRPSPSATGAPSGAAQTPGPSTGPGASRLLQSRGRAPSAEPALTRDSRGRSASSRSRSSVRDGSILCWSGAGPVSSCSQQQLAADDGVVSALRVELRRRTTGSGIWFQLGMGYAVFSWVEWDAVISRGWLEVCGGGEVV